MNLLKDLNWKEIIRNRQWCFINLNVEWYYLKLTNDNNQCNVYKNILWEFDKYNDYENNVNNILWKIKFPIFWIMFDKYYIYQYWIWSKWKNKELALEYF